MIAAELERLATLLSTRRFWHSSEDELQRGIALVLDEAGIAYAREAELSAGERVDFLVGAVGVEVKVAGSLSQVARQLLRYAPHVDGLLLVTARAQLDAFPPTLGGKPVRVVAIRRGLT